MEVKIYYHHTDCGGVVYYANYLKFFEEARTGFFQDKGVSVKDAAQQGILFVVARQEIDYKYPAFYGDTLEISTRVTGMSGLKIIFEYEVKNQDKRLISQAKTIVVCVGKDFKPQAIPEEIRKRIT